MTIPEIRNTNSHTQRAKSIKFVAAGALIALAGASGFLFATSPASAIGTAVDLGTAGSYSVLGGASVTNTGPSVLNKDLGVSPGTAITGFPPGLVNGTTHAADAHALQAQSDLTIAYNAAAGQAPDASITGNLGGTTVVPGVYNSTSSMGLTGTLTLDAEGDPNAVFVFQVGSALTTATSSSVVLLNGAQGCNVFWQIGSSATLGTNTTFVGNILALTSITADTGTTVDGRALARNGSVTLDTNTFKGGPCVNVPTSTATSTPTSTATSPTSTPTSTAT
ncbi:MAG: ice-binding family protein, partial [Propionibacteriaceae bacterium]|nr:ice-binding family protein [Propionibacteriaceae bacterium]